MSHKKTHNKSVMVLAAGEVGLKALEILNNQDESKNVIAIVLSEDNLESQNDAILKLARHPIYWYKKQYQEISELITEKEIDLAILAWWPHILKKDFIALFKIGALNFHPSLLPYGRGKYPYYWCFVDKTPFGVTIHWIDQDIDSGQVAFQKQIEVDHTDTAGTIYPRARKAILDLFRENIVNILFGDIPRKHINCLEFPLHYAKDLEPHSEIKLDKLYNARDIINLFRGRSGFEKGGCWYEEDGEYYEIDVKIRRKYNS